MAGIATALRINDQMSAPLRNITDALNLTISSFEAMQSASANSISTASFQAAKQQIAQASAQIDLLSAGMNKAALNNRNLNAETQRTSVLSKSLSSGYGTAAQKVALTVQKAAGLKQRITEARNAQKQFNSAVDGGNNSLSRMVRTAGSMAAVYAGIRATTAAMNKSDTLVSIDARLNLINDGNKTVDELNSMVYDAANRSRGNYEEMVSSVSKLGITAGGSFTDNSEIIRFVENLNKQFTISGASATEASNAMYQLTQAMASGRLQGDEYRSIIENAPMLAKSIADFAGVGLAELKEMSSQGLITADLIKNALFSIEGETNEMFNQIPVRWSDIWNQIKNQSTKAFRTISKELSSLANSAELIENVTDAIGNVLESIYSSAAKWISKLVVMLNEWSQNEELKTTLKQIQSGIEGAANAVFYLLEQSVKFLTWAGKNWSWFKYVVLGVVAAMVVLKITLIGVQLAGMLAAAGISTAWISALWPILLIIGLVMAAIYGLVKIISWMTGESISYIGVLGTMFMLFYAIVRNVVARIANMFLIVAEYFKNVWNSPIYSVTRLFTNFVIDILKLLSQLDITGKLAPIFDSVAESLQATIDASMPDDYKVTNRMEYVNLTDTTYSGYEFGAGLSGAFNGVSSLADVTKEKTDVNKLLNSSQGTEKNTGIAADKLSDSSLADRLRDFTQREAVNRFTTAEIKIEMNNNNSINSELDMQVIWGALEEGLYRAVRDVKEGADSHV
ncbi:MAG: tape measure protein [Methanosarcinales archaeon]|jgi:tape measure domain-containing protein|nr:tape measure protein [Methanosarcinales archaeon]